MGTTAEAVENAWAPWEREITSWQSALDELENLNSRVPELDVVWRGVVDASYGLHSSLSRKITDLTGDSAKEEVLQTYEREILRRCRADWRYDNLPTLELLAHLQHFGGPTRLIDVSKNPFVSLWFAVEPKYQSDGTVRGETDGRLFAFTVKERISLDQTGPFDWGGRGLPWEGKNPGDGWGRVDTPPVLWVPPAYNERISAQNAGFLIGGTPASWANGNRWPSKPGSDERRYLKIEEVRAASSLYVRPATLDRKASTGQYPTFTLRIKSEAKHEIRERLSRRFGFTSATIYPDLFGLANEVLKTALQ